LKTKKYLNISLILLTIFIWGAIGYTYFYKKETAQIVENVPIMTSPVNFVIKKDTFDLVAIKNPFSNSIKTNKKVSQTSKNNTNKEKKAAIPTSVKWPMISYHGYVVQQGSSKKLGILKVNGKVTKKRTQDVILKEFKIKNIYEDSIQLIYKKTLKTFKKQ
jgi:hypothetical protein